MSSICFISISAYGYFNEKVPAGGGAERQFHLLSSNLTNQFDVHLIVGDYGQPSIETRDGVTLHKAYRPNSSASFLERGKQLLQLQRAVRQADADIYITRCYPRRLVAFFSLLSILQKPLVYHIAADPFVEKPVLANKFHNRLYNYAISNMKQVIVQTQYQKDQIQRNWGVVPEIIPNGYYPSDIVDLHETRDYFLWVGRIIKKQKRPHLFLDLAASIPNEEFVLIGPTKGNEKYTERITKRAVNMDNVKYVGRVPPSEIHEYYRRAISLVNTSTFEGFPNTFLEAWRYATPVISLSVNPGQFLCSEPSTKYFASDDLDLLNDIVRELSNSIDKRIKLGACGIQSFTSQYELSSVVNSYQNLIKELC